MGFEKLQQLARSNMQLLMSFEETFPRETINLHDAQFMDQIDEMLDHLVTFIEKLADEEFQDWDIYGQWTFNGFQCTTKAIEIHVLPHYADCGRRVYYRKNHEAITAPMTVNFDECHVLVNFFEGIF